VRFWLGASFVDTGEYVELARAADRLGYHTLALSDHMFFTAYTARYPYSPGGAPPYTADTQWPDPWVTIGAMAAVTTRLRFATNVYIAPARDLFTVAKSVSTAAVLSANRLTFGVGVGWCADEFAQTGQDFRTRGRRLDEMIPALRVLMGGGQVEYHGRYYDFGPLSIAPVPDAHVPVYIGGDSDAALGRAARVGDGWVGNRIYSEDELADLLARLTARLGEHGRKLADFDVIAPMGGRPTVDLYRKWHERGVTGTMAVPWWGNKGVSKVEAMESFAEKIVSAFP
jgi:probable F420-dependent oxidoreductase